MSNKTPPSTNKKKIVLVLEDDPSVQAVYEKLLSEEGYEVTLTTTVDKASNLLEKNQFDLIVLDIMLPGGKNGLDFIESAKRRSLLGSTPILVLSNLDKDNKSSQELGIHEWLVKSNVSAQDVVTKINNILK